MHDEHSTAEVEVSPQWVMSDEGDASVLFLLMPGVLMRSETGFEPVISSIVDAACVSGVSATACYVDDVADSLDPRSAAASILDAVTGAEVDLIVPVALSFSGGELLDELYVQAEMRRLPFTKAPIMVDTPYGATTLKPARWFTKAVPIVPLPFVKKFFVDAATLPSSENIGNAADFAAVTGDPRIQTYADYLSWVAETAHDNLRGVEHSPGLFRAQVSQMATYKGPSERFRWLVRPVYMVCTSVDDLSPTWAEYEEPVDPDVAGPDGLVPVQRPINGTVVQPQAVNRFIQAFEGNIEVLAVRSTHCGFYERPIAWSDAFTAAVSIAASAGPIV